MPLSDIAIRTAKALASATLKLSDGGGLQLWITAKGSKLWHLAYRFNGKQKKLSLGSYPTITLATAREKRGEAKELIAKGVDPSQQRKVDKQVKIASDANTFEAIAIELIDKKRREGKSRATIVKTEWLMKQIYPYLGSRPISDISAADVLILLKRVELKERIVTAHKLRGIIG